MDMERMEHNIDDNLKILDRFEHPRLSEEQKNYLVKGMLKCGKGRSRRLILIRLVFPLAAAALIAITVSLFFEKETVSVKESEWMTGIVSAMELASETYQEVNPYMMVYYDLDFDNTTTQPVANGNHKDENSNEFNELIYEVVNG
jgi:uncharacterized membrane protein YraQ (UPF0718 family)